MNGGSVRTWGISACEMHFADTRRVSGRIRAGRGAPNELTRNHRVCRWKKRARRKRRPRTRTCTRRALCDENDGEMRSGRPDFVARVESPGGQSRARDWALGCMSGCALGPHHGRDRPVAHGLSRIRATATQFRGASANSPAAQGEERAAGEPTLPLRGADVELQGGVRREGDSQGSDSTSLPGALRLRSGRPSRAQLGG